MTKKQKLVKRYANRKLYDTQRSCYVTLDEIAEMIRTGDDVRVLDNKTKEDLTAVTFAQIIFESEKRMSRMPLALLRGLIQSGNEALTDLVNRAVTQPVQQLKAETEKMVERVVHRSEEAREEARAAIRDLVQSSSSVLEEWQHRVDDRVGSTMGTMGHLVRMGSDLGELKERLDALEKKLSRHERDLGARRG
ncbi:MAG: polyhydroxyalkanoate synthesis regulator DNA-binding domain-containing protein [Deltaproteobacteria bacterium]|nr:polyhydroxyalkanoate synthesis regulator DNA-binding domain-containing protein [Deltaproteobacteria bacterium]